MGDGQALLLIFLIIYLTDSVAWFGPRGVLFVRHFGKQFSIRRHRVFFDGFGSGFSLLNPIPPLGEGYVGSLFPFSLSEKGISPFGAENLNPGAPVLPLRAVGAIPWDQIESVSVDGKKLLINKKTFYKFTATYSALFWCHTLQSLRASKNRKDGIAQIVNRYLQPNGLGRKLAIFRRSTISLRIKANILFLLTFILLPLVYWMFRDSKQLLITCLFTWIMMIDLAIHSFVLHRRFFPKVRLERWQHLILSVFLPNHAIRSFDVLSKRLFHQSHPFAIIKALADQLGDSESLETFETQFAREIAFPAKYRQDSEEKQCPIRQQFRDDYYLPKIKELFPEWQTRSQTQPNREESDQAEFYCPRCHTFYQSKDAVCDECGGLSVQAMTAQ